MAPRNNETQIRRMWLASNIGLAAAGAVDDIMTLTAMYRLRIRGWDFVCQIGQWEPTAVGGRVMGNGEITRAITSQTDFGLQVARTVIHGIQDILAADYVGGVGSPIATLRRWLTKEEANQLGLVLDYGESINVINELEQVGAGASGHSIHGYFFYDQI